MGWRWVEVYLDYLRSLGDAADLESRALEVSTTGPAEMLQLALRLFAGALRLVREAFAEDPRAGLFPRLFKEQCGKLIFGDLHRFVENIRTIKHTEVAAYLTKISGEERSRLSVLADEVRIALKDSATESLRACDGRFYSLQKAPLLPLWVLQM